MFGFGSVGDATGEVQYLKPEVKLGIPVFGS
jgi:hypothetical protein